MIDRHNSDATDEALSALLDGELDTASAQQLEARLATDPELAQRYARLERANRDFQAAARSLDEAPLPEGVLALLDKQHTDNVTRLEPRRWRLARAEPLPLAQAAGIALVVGFLAALLVSPMSQDSGIAPAPLLSGTVAPATPLHRVLQAQPSGAVAQLDGMDVVPVQTFETGDGTICRELHLRGAQGRTLVLACREDSDWLLRATEFVPSDGSGGYQTASSSVSIVAAAVERVRQGSALDPEAEAALLERWSQP